MVTPSGPESRCQNAMSIGGAGGGARAAGQRTEASERREGAGSLHERASADGGAAARAAPRVSPRAAGRGPRAPAREEPSVIVSTSSWWGAVAAVHAADDHRPHVVGS